MTDKELHHLTRRELLAIMLEQQKEIERLQEELEKKEKLLESRKMLMRKAGSIAEASLRISEVFEAAQHAADRYLMSVKASVDHGMLEPSGAPVSEEKTAADPDTKPEVSDETENGKELYGTPEAAEAEEGEQS